ncbi:MAG: MBL fold metallo-hydrolase [Bacteroidales bacterium]|nr:MBL fold metallo-hydrolase [Bacteroidales bacterium]
MTKLTFLGTGTSQGVPLIGCECEVCRSSDPRDKRLRSAAFVEYKGLNMAIDAGPDFRQQMLRRGVRHLDAILLTHGHMDHIGGLDDVRSFNYIDGRPVNICCEERVEDSLRQVFSYAFAEKKYPGAPEWKIRHISAEKPFTVTSNLNDDTIVWTSGVGYTHVPAEHILENLPSAEIIPIQCWHDAMRRFSVLGYRFGNIAYLTDVKTLDDCELEKLKGLDVCTMNCVKYGTHHSHLGVDEAIAMLQKIGAKRSYLTHLSHVIHPHAILEKELPEGIYPAYDGLTVESEE